MIPVPEITALDLAFGNIKHLPDWKKIPEIYKERNGRTLWNTLICKWFFGGLTQKDLDELIPKPGVDKGKALDAIKAILGSWAPKHEHKEAGTAYLLSEWFEEPKVKDDTTAANI